jgi:tetratricopeptide (TPR) repeat protein
MGLHEKAISYGKRARKIAESLVSDQFLFFKSLGGMGFNYFFMGETKKSFELGKTLLDYGNRHSNVRSLVVGHISMGIGYLNAGNFSTAIETFQRGIETSADPFYIQWPKMFLGMTYVQNNQFEEAEKALLETSSYAAEFGCESIGSAANAFLGVLQIVNGHFSKGLDMLQEARQLCLNNERKSIYTISEYLLGKVYFQIVAGEEKISLLTMAKNIGFVVKNVPFAAKSAEDHFNKAIAVAEEIGARGVEGQALLDLGRLHKVKGRKEKARECFVQSIKIFEECAAEVFLKQANEALGSVA